MSYLNQNIKYLRKLRAYTQADLAERIGIKRSLIGAYEEERAEPKIETIQKLSYLFDLSLDQLINQDLSTGIETHQVDTQGKTLRILPIVIDQHDQEQISIVPVSARAGYAHGYADPEYISELPKFNLPLPDLYPDKSYRLFQLEGDSMLPIPDGSYVICEYIENWHNIKDGECYIVITLSQGIVYKRVWREPAKNRLLLRSDNVVYEPFYADLEDVVEIWRSLAFLSFDLPDPEEREQANIQQLSSLVLQLKSDVDKMKKN
jgi:transcriptional regulator with XRE-family HTH domain